MEQVHVHLQVLLKLKFLLLKAKVKSYFNEKIAYFQTQS